MKVALIPPIPSLRAFGQGEFHLLLSHLLDSPLYASHYILQRKLGAYLVLDNSAHENGEGDDPEALMYKANRINAQEVVVPDVLFDGEKTVEKAISAHEVWLEKRPSATDIVRQKGFMYVPQGKTYEEWRSCLNELVSTHLYMAKRYDLKRSFVIGLSKDYEMWDGGLMRLLDEDLVPLRQDLLKKDIQMLCHLLGWGRNLWDLGLIAKKHVWIRSTDSAKPFVYALNGVNLGRYDLSVLPPVYPGRSPVYFQTPIQRYATHLSRQNILVFKALAEGKSSLWGR